MGLVLATFTLPGLVVALLWFVIAVLNYWIWSKAKANGNLLMMVGAGWLALSTFLALLGVYGLSEPWLHVLGVAALAGGFYLSVKPMVQANLAALQTKVKNLTQDRGQTPPT